MASIQNKLVLRSLQDTPLSIAEIDGNLRYLENQILSLTEKYPYRLHANGPSSSTTQLDYYTQFPLPPSLPVEYAASFQSRFMEGNSATVNITLNLSSPVVSSFQDDINLSTGGGPNAGGRGWFFAVGVWDENNSNWLTIEKIPMPEWTWDPAPPSFTSGFLTIEEIIDFFIALPNVTCTLNQNQSTIDWTWNIDVPCGNTYYLKWALVDENDNNVSSIEYPNGFYAPGESIEVFCEGENVSLLEVGTRIEFLFNKNFIDFAAPVPEFPFLQAEQLWSQIFLTPYLCGDDQCDYGNLFTEYGTYILNIQPNTVPGDPSPVFEFLITRAQTVDSGIFFPPGTPQVASDALLFQTTMISGPTVSSFGVFNATDKLFFISLNYNGPGGRPAFIKSSSVELSERQFDFSLLVSTTTFVSLDFNPNFNGVRQSWINELKGLVNTGIKQNFVITDVSDYTNNIIFEISSITDYTTAKTNILGQLISQSGTIVDNNIYTLNFFTPNTPTVPLLPVNGSFWYYQGTTFSTSQEEIGKFWNTNTSIETEELIVGQSYTFDFSVNSSTNEDFTDWFNYLYTNGDTGKSMLHITEYSTKNTSPTQSIITGNFQIDSFDGPTKMTVTCLSGQGYLIENFFGGNTPKLYFVSYTIVSTGGGSSTGASCSSAWGWHVNEQPNGGTDIANVVRFDTISPINTDSVYFSYGELGPDQNVDGWEQINFGQSGIYSVEFTGSFGSIIGIQREGTVFVWLDFKESGGSWEKLPGSLKQINLKLLGDPKTEMNNFVFEWVLPEIQSSSAIRIRWSSKDPDIQLCPISLTDLAGLLPDRPSSLSAMVKIEDICSSGSSVGSGAQGAQGPQGPIGPSSLMNWKRVTDTPDFDNFDYVVYYGSTVQFLMRGGDPQNPTSSQVSAALGLLSSNIPMYLTVTQDDDTSKFITTKINNYSTRISPVTQNRLITFDGNLISQGQDIDILSNSSLEFYAYNNLSNIPVEVSGGFWNFIGTTQSDDYVSSVIPNSGEFLNWGSTDDLNIIGTTYSFNISQTSMGYPSEVAVWLDYLYQYGDTGKSKLKITEWKEESYTATTSTLHRAEFQILSFNGTSSSMNVQLISGFGSLTNQTLSGDPISKLWFVNYDIVATGGSIPGSNRTDIFTSTTYSTVTHNFGFYPQVSVLNESGEVFVPQSIIHDSLDSFTVIFSTPSSGTIISNGSGPQGIAGPAGSTGSIGESGVTGPQGATGPKGQDASTVLNYSFGSETSFTVTHNLGSYPIVDVVDSSGYKLSYDSFTVSYDSTMSTTVIFDTATTGTLLIGGGLTGTQGPQGSGDTGPQGPTGSQGVQGITGPRGFQGRTGPIGPIGPMGFTGNQGITGPQGDQGEQGPQGDLGPQGYQGVQGPTGTQGRTGVQGTTGFQGTQGITGPQGEIGTQGFQGFTGPQGNPGRDANSTLVSTFGTTSVVTVTHSFGSYPLVQAFDSSGYKINSSSYSILYGSTDSYILTFNGPFSGKILTGGGLTGPQGFQGFQGRTGPTGPQGFQGRQGTTGPQGVQGFQGVQGPQGRTGFTGPQGFQGITGSQGNPGPQGITGRQGTTGPQGLMGPSGVQGMSGPQGFQGRQGITGPQGFQGRTGSQGFTGVQGRTGPTGTQGITGPQGFQGRTGPAGPQGVAANSVLTSAVSATASITVTHSFGAYPIVQVVDDLGYKVNSTSYSIYYDSLDAYTITFDEARTGTILSGGGLTGPQGPQGPIGDQGDMGPLGPTGLGGENGNYLIAHDTTNQTNGGASFSNRVVFDTVVDYTGVSLDQGTMSFTSDGTYNIEFTGTFQKTTPTENRPVYIWLKKNGNNVDYSRKEFEIDSDYTHSSHFNWMMNLVSGDTVEIFWSSGDSTVKLHVENYSLSGPSRPSIPSASLNVQQVMYLQTGPTGVQGPTGPQGSSFNYSGIYSETYTYSLNDVVSYEGGSYISTTTSNIGMSPTTYTMSWGILSQKGFNAIDAQIRANYGDGIGYLITYTLGTPSIPSEPGEVVIKLNSSYTMSVGITQTFYFYKSDSDLFDRDEFFYSISSTNGGLRKNTLRLTGSINNDFIVDNISDLINYWKLDTTVSSGTSLLTGLIPSVEVSYLLTNSPTGSMIITSNVIPTHSGATGYYGETRLGLTAGVPYLYVFTDQWYRFAGATF